MSEREYAAEEAQIREAARWLRAAAEKCCPCNDPGHCQQYAYGTVHDVRISRETTLGLADLLDAQADAGYWPADPDSRAALTLTYSIMTGTPGTSTATTGKQHG